MGSILTFAEVIVSEFNKLEGNRYFDTESQTSFEIDHITQVGNYLGREEYGMGKKDTHTVLDCLCSSISTIGITKCRFDVSAAKNSLVFSMNGLAHQS